MCGFMTPYSLADVNLLYDTTDFFHCRNKGNRILQLLKELDKSGMGHQIKLGRSRPLCLTAL